MKGFFITLEGTEGSGKSTQLPRLARRLRELGYPLLCLREPGGTPVGEEIRHTLKHSQQSGAMTPETELLLMNASRAQLVREVIRPALERGELVLCDRFYDSTTAYQGYGRQLDLGLVEQVIRFAVGDTRPDLTLLLRIPVEVSEGRRHHRSTAASTPPGQPEHVPHQEPAHDRFEAADRSFFERVERGFDAIAAAEPDRVFAVDATRTVAEVETAIWERVEAFLQAHSRTTAPA